MPSASFLPPLTPLPAGEARIRARAVVARAADRGAYVLAIFDDAAAGRGGGAAYLEVTAHRLALAVYPDAEADAAAEAGADAGADAAAGAVYAYPDGENPTGGGRPGAIVALEGRWHAAPGYLVLEQPAGAGLPARRLVMIADLETGLDGDAEDVERARRRFAREDPATRRAGAAAMRYARRELLGAVPAGAGGPDVFVDDRFTGDLAADGL